MATGFTLRVARGKADQQRTIDDWLRTHTAAADVRRAIVAEGAFFDLVVPADVVLERLAAGCVCCVGLLPLQVTLTRLVRRVRPTALLLVVTDDAHIEHLMTLVASGKLGVALEQGG